MANNRYYSGISDIAELNAQSGQPQCINVGGGTPTYGFPTPETDPNPPAKGRKTFTFMPRYSDYSFFSAVSCPETVSAKDIREYKEWKEGRLDNPSMLLDFDSNEKYDEFMKGIADGSISRRTDSEDRLSPINGVVRTKTLTFSGLSLPDLDTKDMGPGNLISTLLASQMFAHEYHFVSYGDIAAHFAFESYYKDIEGLVDTIAEKIMAGIKITAFKNEVFPKGSAIEYFERLKSYVDACAFNIIQMPEIHKSSFQSCVDEVVNLIDATLYKLKRLGTGDDMNKDGIPAATASEPQSTAPMDNPVPDPNQPAQPPVGQPLEYAQQQIVPNQPPTQ